MKVTKQDADGIDTLWREFNMPMALERPGQQAHGIADIAPGDGASERVPELAFVDLVPDDRLENRNTRADVGLLDPVPESHEQQQGGQVHPGLTRHLLPATSTS